jgi:poly-gamma-glutamate synthesis protein (capsule biosynthesis protein)
MRLAVTGDLLLTTASNATSSGRGLECICAEIREIFAGCDVVLGNFECTLPAERYTATEPRLFTTEKQMESLRYANINLVTQANNHAFDAWASGFEKTREKLRTLGIKAFGAGHNLHEANAATSFVCNGIRIAFFAAVAPSTGMKHFASTTAGGVATFDENDICTRINELKHTHDHVLFIPHWGEERFRLPSPEQIKQAHRFIDAGASAILGHHPHVLQGSEHYQQGYIAYSLGNFLSNNVYWENGDTLTWNRFERTSKIVVLEFDPHRITRIEDIPVYDDGNEIRIDRSRRARRILRKADNYLGKGISASAYAREGYRVRSLLPIMRQMRWQKLRRMRPEHIRKAMRILSGR